jgi:hypothetical protein
VAANTTYGSAIVDPSWPADKRNLALVQAARRLISRGISFALGVKRTSTLLGDFSGSPEFPNSMPCSLVSVDPARAARKKAGSRDRSRQASAGACHWPGQLMR